MELSTVPIMELTAYLSLKIAKFATVETLETGVVTEAIGLTLILFHDCSKSTFQNINNTKA